MKINEYFDKIYCINIDRRTDRWETCSKEFIKHDLIVERFSAVDGNVINHNLGYPYDNELAGAMSHLNVIKTAKENNLKNVLILEDDVVFVDDLNEQFSTYVTQLPDNWDSIYFGGNHIGGLVMIQPNVGKTRRTYALHAYGVNSRAYDTIINYMTTKINQTISGGKSGIQHSVAADYFIADLQPNMNFYCFRPHIAYQADGFSDIQQTNVSYPFLK